MRTTEGRRKVRVAIAAVATAALWLGLVVQTGAASPTPVDQGDSEREAKLRSAMLRLYVHGVDDALAKEVVEEQDLPLLRRLLLDPTFPRRDNVVAFLAHRDGGAAVAPLLAFLQDPPASLQIPQEERGVLLVPLALGHIARRGNREALTALLEITKAGPAPEVLEAASSRAPDPEAFLSDLYEAALRGLAFSGSPEARARIEAVGRGQIRPRGGARDLSRSAREALDLFDDQVQRGVDANAPSEEASRDSDRALDARKPTERDLSGSKGAAPGEDVYELLGEESRDAPLTWANHPAVSNPMTTEQLTVVLRHSSLKLGREDYSGDSACCDSVSPGGTAQVFGSLGDGLDIVTNEGERDAVLNNPVSRVKVVRQISYCHGPGTNIIGCGWIGDFGMAVVRYPALPGTPDPVDEGALWVHEYGHNVGFEHTTEDVRRIMYPSIGESTGMASFECFFLHFFHLYREGVVETGVCEDADGDLVMDNVDNCAGLANHDQEDSDLDGVGNACDPCPPHVPSLLSPGDGSSGVAGAPTLDWTDALGATSYDVQVSTSPNFATLVASESVPASTWQVTPLLTAGTTYYWHVRAASSCGTSNFSVHFSFATCAMSAPSLVSPANGASPSVIGLSLDWSDVLEATAYDVQVATDAGFTGLVRDHTVIGSSNWRISPQLNPGTTYHWRARARGPCGNTAWSTPRTFTSCPAPGTALASPANGSVVATLTPLLAWQNVSGATGYTVEVALDVAFTQIIRSQSTTASQWTLTAPLRGNVAPYYWRVRVQSACGSAYSSVFSFKVCPPSPSGTVLWQDVPPLPQGGRAEPAVVYDSGRHQTLVFGGCGGTSCALSNDLWAYDHWTGTWTQIVATGGPSPRMGASAIYDHPRARLIVFGGRTAPMSDTPFNDAFALTLTGTPTWSPLGTAGAAPNYLNGSTWAVNDAPHDRMIVGAFGNTGYRVFDYATSVWSAHATVSQHPITRGGSVIYDSVNNRLIAYGGYSAYQGFIFTLAVSELPLNVGQPNWSLVTTGGPYPEHRAYHSAVYDASNQRMLVYGGWYGVTYGGDPLYQYGDVHQLTLAPSSTPTWSELTPMGAAPTARMGHEAVLATYEMISFGGAGSPGSLQRNDNHKLNYDVIAPSTPGSLNATLGSTDGTLSWVETGDSGTFHRAQCFDTRMSTAPITAGNFSSAALVALGSPQFSGTTENVSIPLLDPCTSYYFAVKVIDDKGNASGIRTGAASTQCNCETIYLSGTNCAMCEWTGEFFCGPGSFTCCGP